MASIYDKASLVLIPSGTKTSKVYSQVPTNGDGDFTFSRSTAATKVNASGNIEKETQNLLTQSNTFSDSDWDKLNVSVTGGQSGYDGSSDAWLLEKVAGFRYISQSVTNSSIKAFSIYAKAGSLGKMRMRVSGGTSPDAYFDLTNGTIQGGSGFIDTKIEDVGGGWYRCSVIDSQPVTLVYIYPVDVTSDWSITGNIYIQDAQLEQGLVARDYIETTTTAIYGGITDNVPRLDYQGSCPALLLEPQRTNLMTHSEYFAGWNAITNVSINHNESNSPEGVQNATEIVPNTSNDIHFIDKSGFNRTAGEYITTTIYAKANGYDYLYLSLSASRLYGVFDISNGAVMLTNSNGTDFNNDSGSIEDVGNGWYRCTLIGQAQSTFGTYLRVSCAPTSTNTHTPIFAGDGTSGVLVYGAQVELNSSYATSYIPTYGSAVTRNADRNIKIESVSDLIGQTEGTLFFEGNAVPNTEIISIHRSTLGSIFILSNGSGLVQFYAWYGNGVTINHTANIDAGSNFKAAFAYKNGDSALYCNGQQIALKTEVFDPQTTLSSIWIAQGNYAGSKNKVNAKQALVFKTRLSNEELAALTTI